MATLPEKTRTILAGDSALALILTGGVWDDNELDRRGLTLEQAVTQTDGYIIKPMAYVKWDDEIPVKKPLKIGAEYRFVKIYFYQHVKFDKINLARKRTKAILDQKDKGTTDQEYMAFFEWNGDTGEFIDEEMGNARCRISRYSVLVTLK